MRIASLLLALVISSPARADRECDLVHDALAVGEPQVWLKYYPGNPPSIALFVAEPLNRPRTVKRVTLSEHLEYKPIGSRDAVVRLKVDRAPGPVSPPDIEEMPMMVYDVPEPPRSLTITCGTDTVHRVDRIEYGE